MVTRRSLLVGSAAVLGTLSVARATAAQASAPQAAALPAGAASGFSLPGGLFCPVPYMNRAAWGADESLRYTNNGGYWTEEWYPVQALTVHHTGFAAAADPAQTVRDIYVKQTTQGDGVTGGGVGWGDIGYNLLIDDQGVVYEGRYSGTDNMPVFNTDGNMVTGAHVLHYNTGNVGVCLLGFLDDPTQLTQAAEDSLATVLAYLAAAGRVNPTGTVHYVNAAPGYTNYTKTVNGISGHRDWAATDCPGSALYPLLPGIRTRVAAAEPQPVPSQSSTEPATSSPSPSATGSGQPTTAPPSPTPTPTPHPTPTKSAVVVRDRGGDAYVDTARKVSPTAYPTKPKPKLSASASATASPTPLSLLNMPASSGAPSTFSTSVVASADQAGGAGWAMGTTVAGVVAAGALGSLGAWWSRQRRSAASAAAAAPADAAEPSIVDGAGSMPEVRPVAPAAADETPPESGGTST
jgi:hypothetical protein